MTDRGTPPPPAEEPEQGNGRRADFAAQYDAMDVLAYLLAGPITFGGLGWLGDRWLHTSFLLPIGTLAGVALALYTVWVRYGRSESQ